MMITVIITTINIIAITKNFDLDVGMKSCLAIFARVTRDSWIS